MVEQFKTRQSYAKQVCITRDKKWNMNASEEDYHWGKSCKKYASEEDYYWGKNCCPTQPSSLNGVFGEDS